jgi:hypothetical protein
MLDSTQKEEKKPSTETTPEVVKAPAIKSEEEFHDKLEAAKEKVQSESNMERFAPLADSLHEKLKLQDSEAALTLITK